ncbi:hypothetical protein ES703_19046 [subsurface metagenome]
MKKKDSKEIQLLRTHKTESGLSYPKLGKELGVSGMTIYNWFRGKQKPSDMANRLIRTYLLSIKLLKKQTYTIREGEIIPLMHSQRPVFKAKEKK